jgi:DNA-binding XRE family transcriptional regulator
MSEPTAPRLILDRANRPLPTPAQIRAARALVKMTQDELAEISGVHKRTIADYELSDLSMLDRTLYARTLAEVVQALEEHDIVFVDEDATAGAGVRLAKPLVRIEDIRAQPFHGPVTFRAHYKGRLIQVTMPSSILEDLDRYRGPARTPQETVEAFKRNRVHIIAAVQAALDAVGFNPDPSEPYQLHLGTADFPALH